MLSWKLRLCFYPSLWYIIFSTLGIYVILLCEKEALGTATRCLLVDQVLQGQEDLTLLRRDCHQQ